MAVALDVVKQSDNSSGSKGNDDKTGQRSGKAISNSSLSIYYCILSYEYEATFLPYCPTIISDIKANKIIYLCHRSLSK
jgi:hypothetical protein